MLAAVEIFIIVCYDSPLIINALILILIAGFAVITRSSPSCYSRSSPYLFTTLALANGIK